MRNVVKKKIKALKNKCPLCGTVSHILIDVGRKYFICRGCSGIFCDPQSYVCPEDEKKRYEQHNNDVFDAGYRSFVKPVTDRIADAFRQTDRGLDFGSGTGPVIAAVLEEKGYNIEKYDPFFCDRPEVFRDSYDYISCCEVVEHFHDPYKEFGLLRTLLKKEGMLYVMTDLFTGSPDEDFKKWYYKDDPTHVFFYRDRTFNWIFEVFGFQKMERCGRVVVFKG